MIAYQRSAEEKRRDRHDIIVEILKVAKDGKIKTDVMCEAKLSYQQLNYYLPLLVEKKFLEKLEINKGRIKKVVVRTVYRTTLAGEQLISTYENFPI